MNEEDRRIRADEVDAEPDRFPASAAASTPSPEKKDFAHEKPEAREALSRTVTASTSSDGSSTTSAESGSPAEAVEAVEAPEQRARRPTYASRASTQYESEYDLERHPTALSRIQTARSQHVQTVGTSLRSRTVTRQSKLPLPAFGGGKPYPPPLPEREEYVVEFDGPDDLLHPMNWRLQKKLRVALSVGFITFTAAFGSSIFSAAIGSVAEVFGVSQEVGILGVSLYVLGFATGPMLWAPLSELSGRRIPLLTASFGMCIFNIAVAVAKDLQTVFICRFFAGFFGACPLAVTGAVFADMFNNRQRGLALTVFSVAVFGGPLMAPFIGGFINKSYLGWRWTEYIVAIMGFLGLGLALLFLEETYPPVVLVNKAADLRRRTKNWGIHAKQEEIEIDLRELLEKNLSRPFRMLFTEPIVLLLSIYMAFIYGLLYLFLTAYPIVFQQIHGIEQGVASLPYFGMIAGELIAGIYVVTLQPSYNKKLAANNNMPIPEWRLPPAIIGGVLFALGCFWFGWGGYKESIPWIVPTLSGLFTGFGLLSIFLQCLNYLVDAYLMFAASAIAANTFLRSLCGAGFPLFATYMIEGMGVQWAGTLLGCVALLLVPLPIIFYYYGSRIRERSKFAPTFPIASQASHTTAVEDTEKNE